MCTRRSPARAGTSITIATLCATGLLLVLVLAGCQSGEHGEAAPNQPPNVWISAGPPEGTTEKYIIHFFWGGWDPDGEIAYYEFAITDNGDGPFNPADTVGRDKWSRVNRNDSVFVFSADQLSDSSSNATVSEFTRSHTFFVRAIDEQGLPSADPAYRSFTALTLSPQVWVTTPRRNGRNAAQLPPYTTFQWTARDYVADILDDQDPDSTQFALISTVPFNEDWDDAIDYLRKVPEVLARYGKTAEESDAEWSDWLWYDAPGDSGRSWTTPELPFGPYIFAVRAKDDAGAVTPVLDQVENVRLVDVTTRSNGPVFEVSNEFMGLVRTSSCVTPVTVIDLPASVEIVFRWRADASSYGGTVAGYRYGWDIDDLNDPTQWETDLTPFTSSVATSPGRHFYYGTHTFSVEVVDDSGQCARAEIKINIVEFPMKRSLLIVDDFPADEQVRQAGWDNPTGGGTLPTDAEHKRFWVDIADNVAGFSPEGDVMRVSGDHPFQLAQVGNYKSIIWSVFSDVGTLNPPTLIYQYIRYRQKNIPLTGKREPNVIALFLAAGGHVLITGRHPVSNIINRDLAHGSRFPFLTRYEQEGQTSAAKFGGTLTPVGDKSFGYLDLCLESLDFAIMDALQRRDETFICSIQLDRPLSTRRVLEDGMRAGIPLQPGFERIELRPEATSSGRAYAPDKRSYEAEIYNPQYFSDICIFAPQSRDCFEPIYGLDCPNTASPCYAQPVAFWTSTYADRLAEVAGAVRARSAVFGFPPVYFNPDQVKPGIEHILFCEWQLDPLTPYVCNH